MYMSLTALAVVLFRVSAPPTISSPSAGWCW